MIQCQGCTCAGWLWEGEGGLGDHQPGVYVPLKALFLVSKMYLIRVLSFICDVRFNVWGEHVPGCLGRG